MTSLSQNVIRHKIGLLNLAIELGNVSKACGEKPATTAPPMRRSM